MKKVIVSSLVILGAIFLSGCSQQQVDQNNVQAPTVAPSNDVQAPAITPSSPSVTNPEQGGIENKNDDFAKKVECSNQKPKIEAALGGIATRTGKNVVLNKVFFSRERNSCLFAYVIEDGNSPGHCILNAQIVHYDTFIIEDYLNSQQILVKTKGCDNYWGDSFEKDISALEK